MSGATGRREVAHRLFATEYDDASLEYAESDEERAPNYVVTPTGARVNRVFVVGVLTSVEQVNEDTVRARIADPTGAFVVYAGQYQPDELAALQSMESPAFVAITGKANTFQPDGSDRVLTSIRPESVTEVDAETRDRWVVTAAEHTLGRIETAAQALAREERGDDLVAVLRGEGVDPSLAEGVARAIEHYDTTADYLGALREVAMQAVEVVAGERSEAESLDVEPDASTGTYGVGDLVDSAPDAASAVTEVAGPIEDVEIDDLGTGTDAEASVEAAETGEPDDTGSSADSAADEAIDEETLDEETTDDEATAGETATSSGDQTDTQASDESQATDESQTASGDESAASASDDTTTASSEETTAASEETSEAETASASAETAEPDTASSGDEDAADAADADADDAVAEQVDADDAEETLDADDVDGDLDPEDLEDVVDDEERERIEEEYGVGFESGAEVDEPGEAGIDAPDEAAAGEAATDEGDGAADAADDAGETADADAATETDASTDAAEDADDAAASESEDTSDDADGGDDAGDVDLEAALLDQMADMDGDEGAERAALVDAVAEETGADEAAVEDAIEDALMSGKCYEPSEGVYKPI